MTNPLSGPQGGICGRYFIGVSEWSLLSGKEQLQNVQIILGSITPQNGAECRNSFFSASIVSTITDVPHMWPELFYNFLDISELLGRQVGVVQQPVESFSIFVSGTKQFHSISYQCEQFVAALNAAGVVFNLSAAQVRTGHIDGIQKIINADSILDLKLVFNLLDRQLQAPHHIPVLFQQLPCVVVAGIFLYAAFIGFLFHCQSLLIGSVENSKI